MLSLREDGRQRLLPFLQDLGRSHLGSLVRGDPNSLYMQIILNQDQLFKDKTTIHHIYENLKLNIYRYIDQIVDDLHTIANNCKVISENSEILSDNANICNQLKMYNLISTFILKKSEKMLKIYNFNWEQTITDQINKINQIFNDMPTYLKQYYAFSASFYSIIPTNQNTDYKRQIPFQNQQNTVTQSECSYECPFTPSKQISRQQSLRIFHPSEKKPIERMKSVPIHAFQPQNTQLMQRVASKGISRQNTSDLSQEEVKDTKSTEESSIESQEIQKEENFEKVELRHQEQQEQSTLEDEEYISDFEEEEDTKELIIPVRPPLPKHKMVKTIRKKVEKTNDSRQKRKRILYGKSVQKGYGPPNSKTVAFFRGANDPEFEESSESEYEYDEIVYSDDDNSPSVSFKLPEQPPRYSIPSRLCILNDLAFEPPPRLPPAPAQGAKKPAAQTNKRQLRVIFDRDELALLDDSSSSSDNDDYTKVPKSVGRPRKIKEPQANFVPPPEKPHNKRGRPPGRKNKVNDALKGAPKKVGRTETGVTDEDEELFCINIQRAQEFLTDKQRIKLAKKLRRIIVNSNEILDQEISGMEINIDLSLLSNHTKAILIKTLRTLFLDNGHEY